MGILTQVEREGLEAQALAEATQNKSSQAIVVALQEYSQAHGLVVSDGELFVIADLAQVRRASPASGQAAPGPQDFPPRSRKDRRIHERRHGPRRNSDRRRTGLSATVEALRRVGQPERRSGRDRRAARDRRQLLRRRRIRRTDER